MFRLIFKIDYRLRRKAHKFRCRFIRFRLQQLYAGRVSIASDCIFGKDFEVAMDIFDSTLRIGSEVQFRNHCVIRSGEHAQVSIGHRVFFNDSCSINSLIGIEIGDDVSFGENVRLYDSNHAYQDKSRPIPSQGYTYGKIRIGNNCWIGSNVCILKGVTIGNNVIIGAGSIVHQSIPDNTIVYVKQELVSKNY